MKNQSKIKRKGIRRRWMTNSILGILVIVLFAVVAFTFAMAGYMYNTMASGLEGRVNAATDFMSNNVDTESAYNAAAKSYVLSFEDRDIIELQFLSASGRVTYSSSNLTAGSMPGTPDITAAASNKSTSPWEGNDPNTNERIMAVSAPVLNNGSVVGIMRVVTSLRLVDKQVAMVAGISVLIGLGIIGLVYFSNLYFIRSIIDPVASVTETAKRIAAGSYGVQMEKEYDDEVGDLIDAINDMSLKIDQAEKTQSDFISSVSHELRTPLTAINGWAETLYNGEVRSAEDVKKGMGIIVSEARRLTNMVEELLEFSRIEDGRFTLSIELIDIKAELEDAVYTYREFFKRKGITLTYEECDEEFPPIEGDPQRLRQVFCNLLDNADKHGGSGMRIDTSIKKENDQIAIRIRDYGPGIPPEELPHVKYKFYKGSSKARGSGIGLAVCEEIVNRHNGKLDIGNAEGGGCVVTVWLPIGT